MSLANRPISSSLVVLVGLPLPKAAEDYLEWLATIRRASPLTIESYRHDLAYLQQSALQEKSPITPDKSSDNTDKKSEPFDFSTLSEAMIRRLTAKAHASGISSSTLSRRLSAWRSFYRWLVGRDLATINPVQKVRPPKKTKKLPSTLSMNELSTMLDKTPNVEAVEINQKALWPEMKPMPKKNNTKKDKIDNARSQAMFELLYSSGLRLSELWALNMRDARDIMQGEVRVLGKRQKTRIVPVGDKAIEALKVWLTLHPMRGNEEKSHDPLMPLFVGSTGKRLSMRSIQNHLAQWAQVAQIAGRVHPHMLRHSFASHLLQESGDLRGVQEMLGHASIAATQIYTHLDFQNLAKVYDKAHPRAHLKQGGLPHDANLSVANELINPTP